MSKWCARSIFVTAVLVMSRTENAIGGTMKSGIHKTERSNFENGMFGILDFFGSSSDDSKPEFITTFDLMRLSNAEYAMKQFHCLLNENPCDSVGLRLKGKIYVECKKKNDIKIRTST